MKKINRIIYWIVFCALIIMSIVAIFINVNNNIEANSKSITLSEWMLIFDGAALFVSRIVDLKSICKISERKSPFSENQKNYISSKNSLLKSSTCNEIQERSLSECLHLLANEMKTHLKKNRYYELSVFSNKEHPDIIAYYDTNKNTCADSKAKRRKNENYYREMRYEAVELLDNPTPLPVYIPCTEIYNNYSFTGKQKRQIKSQVMLCFHFEDPCVLVVTSNKKNMFSQGDKELEETLKHIALLLECYMIASDKYMCHNNFLCGEKN